MFQRIIIGVLVSGIAFLLCTSFGSEKKSKEVINEHVEQEYNEDTDPIRDTNEGIRLTVGGKEILLRRDNEALNEKEIIERGIIGNWDVNFDNVLDLGVPVSVGYGGVNHWYDFYIASDTQVVLSPHSVLVNVSNPEISADGLVINSWSKSGPIGCEYEYRYQEGNWQKIYLPGSFGDTPKETEMLNDTYCSE